MSARFYRRRIRAGIVGPGFIARHHVDALRRLGYVDIVGASGSSSSSTAVKITDLGIERAYSSYQELVSSPEIDVVHITTPNYLHAPIILAAHAAGKHVICEKPLAMDRAEAELLRDSGRKAYAEQGLVSIVMFNYRGSALVQQARFMVQAGDIGALSYLHGAYLQDWMFSSDVYSWRSDPARGGVSSALADIGSHWCDLAQHIASSHIVAVCADLATTVPQRLRSHSAQETFASTKDEGELVDVSAEDTGSILLRFDNGARGIFNVGQVHAGHKNDLWIEVNGRKASLRWRQERQNELWIGRHDQANQILVKDPAHMPKDLRRFAPLPAGHQEGWADSFFNVMSEAYSWIRAGVGMPKPAVVATFDDGCQIHCVLDAILRSYAAGGQWIAVTASEGKAL